MAKETASPLIKLVVVHADDGTTTKGDRENCAFMNLTDTENCAEKVTTKYKSGGIVSGARADCKTATNGCLSYCEMCSESSMLLYKVCRSFVLLTESKNEIAKVTGTPAVASEANFTAER